MEGYEDLVTGGLVKKKIITAGSGESPSTGKKVTVHYVGKFENGKVFDQSEDPFVFNLGVGQVIKGWDVGVASMKVGEKSQFWIDSSYAYGSRGAGGIIKPNTPLVFDVELIKFA